MNTLRTHGDYESVVRLLPKEDSLTHHFVCGWRTKVNVQHENGDNYYAQRNYFIAKLKL